MKKIISVLLLVCTILACFVACKKDDSPEGYQLVSGEDEIFNLYVPKSWSSNLSSGVAGAYASIENKILVNAKTIRNAKNYTIGEYMSVALDSYKKMDGFELVSDPAQTTLGSYAAYVVEYKANLKETKDGKTVDRAYTFKVISAKVEATFTTLIYTAPTEHYSTYLPQFDEIVAKFEFKTFADGELEKDDFMVLVDENTPEGFQIASNDKYEYRLYVPLTWTVQRRTYNPKAYFSTTDSSNITMNMRVADEDIYDGKTYWEDYQKGTYFNLSEIVIDENAKLGQYPAYGVDYTCEISGVVYKIKQVFLTVNGNIYIFTYTSNRRNYEKHLEDVNKIIEMFEFKK